MTLPRVHAVTDAQVLAQPGFLDQARQHRHPRETASPFTFGIVPRPAAHCRIMRCVLRDALRGSGTALIVNARPDIAAAVSADGVQLGGGDLGVADARRVLSRGWVGRSVHSLGEARSATDEGADFLLAGTIFTSTSHPGAAGEGTGVHQ